MTVAITRTDKTARDLRHEATRWMLAVALVLEGTSRMEAAECRGMDNRALCDWIHRNNAEGTPGLPNCC